LFREKTRGNLRAEWEYIGEGMSGDYDPDDPNDVELLRFSIVDVNTDEQLEDSSYCTQMPVDTDVEILDRALELILDAAGSKRELESLSWMKPEDFAMRTRVRTDTVYNFDELSESAQQTALEWFAQANQECYDPDDLTMVFAETLKEWGFPHDDKAIEYRLSYSQGDGVAFYGTIDVNQYLRKTQQLTKFRPLLRSDDMYIEAWITRNSFGHHYSHYNTMSVESNVENYEYTLTENQHKLAELLQESLEEHVVHVSQELERMGYAELEYITSREYIVEQIEINEYEFTEDGKLI